MKVLDEETLRLKRKLLENELKDKIVAERLRKSSGSNLIARNIESSGAVARQHSQPCMRGFSDQQGPSPVRCHGSISGEAYCESDDEVYKKNLGFWLCYLYI